MSTMGRPTPTLVLTDAERDELQRLTRRASVNRLLAFRARLVLACAEPPAQYRRRAASETEFVDSGDCGLGISSASSTTSVRMDTDTRHPTMRRANTSMTNATYTNPLQVATYVKSDTQS